MAEAPGARVILCGSHARGSASPRNDIDVLVIEPEVDDTGLRVATMASTLCPARRRTRSCRTCCRDGFGT
ncbi:MAG TPA: nucleotidyltransferase domain-containing protein, partial [Baekduia sp.]|nr:nucleotidyltransferase domain-containing protein [Baekduia sp.]